MNTLPKFSEQRDKIIQAYFKDEIQPFNNNFCFCGTLAGNTGAWHTCEIDGYKLTDFGRMEDALLNTITFKLFGFKDWRKDWHSSDDTTKDHRYEDVLFSGMSTALDVLKQIHIEHGEVIEEDIPFVKRELVKL